MRFKALLITVVLVTIIILAACSVVDYDKARSLNDRAVVLFEKHVAFMKNLELTADQRVDLQKAIAEAQLIYIEVLQLYGETSDKATLWKQILGLLVALK